jgi:hypothetical protein
MRDSLFSCAMEVGANKRSGQRRVVEAATRASEPLIGERAHNAHAVVTSARLELKDTQIFQFVEMPGIEPGSVCFLVILLRAQLTGNCRDHHHCVRQR